MGHAQHILEPSTHLLQLAASFSLVLLVHLSPPPGLFPYSPIRSLACPPSRKNLARTGCDAFFAQLSSSEHKVSTQVRKELVLRMLKQADGAKKCIALRAHPYS